jgi:hypothetical protein
MTLERLVARTDTKSRLLCTPDRALTWQPPPTKSAID